jgi:aromatic amino acid aminotransferase I
MTVYLVLNLLLCFRQLVFPNLNDGTVCIEWAFHAKGFALTHLIGHLSHESRVREPCTLKQAARHMKKPGLISLGGGLPSSEVFPIAELNFKVPVAPKFSEKDTEESGQTVSIGKYDVRDRGGTYDLSIACNYGQATGSPQMMRYLTEHTEIVYKPPYADWKVCQTIGSTGALEQALRMFCDKDRGDSILTEDFSFSTALETVGPLGVKAFGVAIDEEGLVPEAMDELLSTWDAKERGSRKPHLLYTVPSGQNPTGATQGTERRKAIYAVAQKHDLYIIEDEPYYFLQMQPYTGRNQPDVAPPETVEEFVSSLIPSLLSIDVDGRVMRMDSFSKVLVPGSRLGWITASAQIVERYIRHAEVASQGPSGFSQVILYKLLDETWGHEGYLRWLMNLRLEYTKKRDALLAACEDHLPSDLVSWSPPVAGMFVSDPQTVYIYIKYWLTNVLDVDKYRPYKASPSRRAKHLGYRRGDFQLLYRERRPHRPRIVVLDREGKGTAWTVL